jgi:hypothetical protein
MVMEAVPGLVRRRAEERRLPYKTGKLEFWLR